MKIRIVCTGKLKERFYADAAAEFKKRLSRFCELEIVELPDEKVADSPSPAEIERVKNIECRRMAEKLTQGEYVIALDPAGREMASEKLAETLSGLEIGEMIPPELYEVVAEILIFVDSMDKIRNKLKG